MAEPRSLHDLSYHEIEHALRADDVNVVHAKKLWRQLHREAAVDLAACDHFLPPLQQWIDQHVGTGKTYFLDHLEQVDEQRSSDGLTRKYLLKLRDGQTIETVLMGYEGRFTACVSTQVGCAMGCVFCATGQMGFRRHLRPGEIIGQVLHVQRVLRQDFDKKLRNLVMMGMGEPLHNYDAVMSALATISDTRGPSLSPQRITVSTVGLVPAIARFAEEKRPYNLAVSLHGASEEQRSALIPISKKWPIDQLIASCRSYAKTSNRKIFIQWTLIAGKNDSPEIAHQLATLLHGINVHINLIPLNITDGYAGTATANKAAVQFQRILREAGYACTFRQRRGIDVAAGCGQLRVEKKSRSLHQA